MMLCPVCGDDRTCELGQQAPATHTASELRAAVVAERERWRTALENCVDAIDRLMGDSDLPEDDSFEFQAIQNANLLLRATPEDD